MMRGAVDERSGAGARRYTIAGDAAAERRIASDLGALGAAVAREIGAACRAVLLVGGYARGEGSLVEQGGALGPYNDYDLVAVVEDGAAGLRDRLAHFAEAQRARYGVDVDVWPIDEAALATVPATLFWLDVAMGAHAVVWGDPSIAASIRALRPRQVPLDEVGRLLANRAVGLALSNLERVDRDLRRARHGHKAVLACGDARLLAADRYRATIGERLAQLESLEGAPAVGKALVDAYRDAVSFRARPDRWRAAGGDLDAWYRAIRERAGAWHLDFEAWRAGSPADPLAFATWSGRVYRALPDVRTGGAGLAAIRAAVRRVAPLFPWTGHPRERLARVAVLLAYGSDRDDCRREAARLLGRARDASDDGALHARLETLARGAG